jgi:hypothetical protein
MRHEQPRWETYGEAATLCVRPSTLRRTIPIALVVGTLLTAINLGGTLLGGLATPATWARVVSNFLIPFVISTLGFLSATRNQVLEREPRRR